jgi:hypothetical protein
MSLKMEAVHASEAFLNSYQNTGQSKANKKLIRVTSNEKFGRR